jgi:hypothetical protein
MTITGCWIAQPFGTCGVPFVGSLSRRTLRGSRFEEPVQVPAVGHRTGGLQRRSGRCSRARPIPGTQTATRSTQQMNHRPATGSYDLRWHPDQEIHECAKLHHQQSAFVPGLLGLFGPAGFRKAKCERCPKVPVAHLFSIQALLLNRFSSGTCKARTTLSCANTFSCWQQALASNTISAAVLFQSLVINGNSGRRRIIAAVAVRSPLDSSGGRRGGNHARRRQGDTVFRQATRRPA